MEPKARTLIERLGFKDPDRNSSKHDSIQIWTYNNIDKIINSFISEKASIYIVNKTLEMPIIHEAPRFKNVIGFIDIFATGYIVNQFGVKNTFYLSIEIKSSISSCGDLIRQINFYRRLQQFSSKWLVISPDDRFSDLLSTQGIGFYKYQSDLIQTTLFPLH